jgi:hypothetical protein
MPRGDGTGPTGQGRGTGRGWDEVKAKAEAEWVDRMPQDRAEIVYARNAQQ